MLVCYLRYVQNTETLTTLNGVSIVGESSIEYLEVGFRPKHLNNFAANCLGYVFPNNFKR